MSYREEVKRTSPSNTTNYNDQLILASLGLAGETGEVIELIKKYVYHAKPIDRDNLVKELGDVRWYFECMLIANDITMEEVENKNIDKLRKRFPNGFTPEAAKAKADEQV